MADKRGKQDGASGEANLQTPSANLPTGYAAFLDDLKVSIREAQVRAAVAVNRELVLIYHEIGHLILERQELEGWGASVITRLAADLKGAFPDMKGFSPRNLGYMKVFAATYPDPEFLQQVAAKLSWSHHCALLDKVKEPSARDWYLRAAIAHGWSRNVLVHQIETRLYERQGQAITNFEAALPSPQSDLARELLKDPYNFDFLTLSAEAQERDLERGLLEHLKKFLLELGQGFAFVGSQYHLEVGGEDFYLDLLFYHLQLRCYVVIELKMGAFKPEYAGKMNFYLSAVDDMLRHPTDQPSIGLILCKERNRLIVEYALRDTQRPMGVAAYQLLESLPETLRASIPSTEMLEAGIMPLEDAE